jgi:hypothetical protein
MIHFHFQEIEYLKIYFPLRQRNPRNQDWQLLFTIILQSVLAFEELLFTRISESYPFSIAVNDTVG